MKFSTLAALRRAILVFHHGSSSSEQGSERTLGGWAVCSPVLVELQKLSSPSWVCCAFRFPRPATAQILHCSTANPSQSWPRTAQLWPRLSAFNFIFLEKAQLFLIAISAILTVKIFFKTCIYCMKTCSLLTTKPKETPIFPDTWLSMDQNL